MRMRASESASATLIWLLLLLATAISYVLGHGAMPLDGRISGAAILLIAFAKARIVGLRFMDLRHAIRPLRFAFEAWIVAVAAALIVLLR
jgi:Prokaryotic Cytochrome C oxidase subunit IV